MTIFGKSKFKKKVEEIKDDNFHLYFFEVDKFEQKPDQIIVRFRQRMDFGESNLKEEVVRYLTEVDGGAINAVRTLMDYGAASKSEAIRICNEIVLSLYKKPNISNIIKRSFYYTVDIYYYTKLEYLPKDPRWSIVDNLN